MQKPGRPDDDPKVRLVTNLKPVKKIVDKIGYPMDGSLHILRRLNPQETCFGVLDLVQGFHQIPLHEDSRDLVTIVLPQGKDVSPKDTPSVLTSLTSSLTLR